MSTMTREEFEALLNGITEGKKEGQQNKNWTYLPQGFHEGRLLFDNSKPKKKYRVIKAHCFGRTYELCPDWLAEQDEEHADQYPVCELCKLIEDAKNSGKDLSDRRAKWKTLAYFYLHKTDKETQYWKPGKLYCIVGTYYFYKEIDNFVDTWSKSPKLRESLFRSVLPEHRGELLTLKVDKDTNVSINGSREDMETDIPLSEETYRSLDDEYISATWNAASYERAVRAFKAELSKESGIKEAQNEAETRFGNEKVPSSVNGVKKETNLSVITVPDGVILPDGCPGWQGYNIDQKGPDGEPLCVMCDYALQCLEAQKSH